MFKDAKRPGDEINPVGIDISVTGDIASAMSDKLTKTFRLGITVIFFISNRLFYQVAAKNYSLDLYTGKTSSYNSTKFPSFFRRQHDRSEEFIKADSGLSEYEEVDEVHYKLYTRSNNVKPRSDWRAICIK